jgi:hypothetical protein
VERKITIICVRATATMSVKTVAVNPQFLSMPATIGAAAAAGSAKLALTNPVTSPNRRGNHSWTAVNEGE